MVTIGLSFDLYLTHKEIIHATNECYDRNGYPTVSKSGIFSSRWSFFCDY